MQQRPDRREVVEVAVENFLETFGVPAIARIEDDDLIIVEYDASLSGRARAEAIKTVLEPAAEQQRHRHRRDTLLTIPILVGVWEAVRAHQRAAVASVTVASTVAAGTLGLAVIERDRPPPAAAPAASSVRTVTMQLPASTTARRTPTKAAPTKAAPAARTSKPPPARSRFRPTVAAANPTRPARPERTRASSRDDPEPTRSRARSRTPAPEPEKEPTAKATSREQDEPTIAAADSQPTRQPAPDDRPTVDEEPTPQPEPQPQPEPEEPPDLQPPPASCRLIELELGRLVRVCL